MVARVLNGAAFYALLLAILTFAIPYGTVQPWHRALFVAAVGVIAGLRIAGNVAAGQFRLAEPRLLLPLIGVLCLAAIQLISPLGTNVLGTADPYETKTFIAVFAGIVIAGEILFFYTTTTARLRMLIGVVIVVGVASALFGVFRAAYLDGAGSLSGYLASGQGYAQFINRNHFAFLMEMTLGLTLGLLIKGELSEKAKFAGWVASGLLIYSIIASDSRGGIVSLIALCIFAVGVHAGTGWSGSDSTGRYPNDARGGSWIKRLAMTGVLCGVVFALVVMIVAFVGGDRVATRMEGIQGETEVIDSAKVNRGIIWDSTIELIKERPVFGSGFGAYAAAITRYDTTGGRAALQQAHNDYLEVLANGGAVGLAMFAVFGFLVGKRAVRNLGAGDRFRRASCFGAVIGIFGVLIHSFVDFGLHILINALIFMVLVVIATADVHRPVWSPMRET
jgi:O-antigen ligase